MPIKKLLTTVKKVRRKTDDKNANCTKMSADNVTTAEDGEEDADGNEFLKATRGDF